VEAKAFVRGTGELEGTFVLLRPIDVIRELAVERHVIELTRRLIQCCAECLAAVDGNVCAAVITDDKNLRIAWVDPDDVIVAEPRPERAPRASAVRRFKDAVDFGGIGYLRIRRVDIDRHIVERALAKLPFAVDALPRRSGIVRTKHAAVLRLNDRI